MDAIVEVAQAVLTGSGAAIGLAACVQSIAGFGFALVAIALLPLFLDLQLAIPLVLTMCLLSNIALLVRYRESFDWRSIVGLVLSALVMIPVGLVGLHYLPEQVARRVLGGFVVLYVAYDMARLVTPVLTMPVLESPRWAYLFGGVSGFLTGAFTTGGPPLVMYANSKEWSPEQFKGNLPAVYVVAIAFALAGHAAEGHLTPELGWLALSCLPLFAVGLAVGMTLSGWIDAKAFKRIVLVLLSLVGLKLMV